MKIISDFVRINNGSFERVTWHKNNSGKSPKFVVTKEMYNPSPDELRRMAQDRYGELNIKL